MRIYLDESKRLGEGKIVFGGFFTKHSHSYIQKFIENKKKDYKIFNKVELKGARISGKYFYEKMLKENNFQILEKSIIGININGYYKDNLEGYKIIIGKLIDQNNNYLKNYKKNINIIADYVNLGKKTRKIELEIEKYLNNNFNFFGKIKFEFVSSENNLGIQIADMISYKLGKTYFFGDELDDFIIENLFNIDISVENKI